MDLRSLLPLQGSRSFDCRPLSPPLLRRLDLGVSSNTPWLAARAEAGALEHTIERIGLSASPNLVHIRVARRVYISL